MKDRNIYFDILRAIAIILVIANHTPWGDTSRSLVVMFYRFVKIAVPLFIAISGFFICKKKITNWSDYTSFLRKQLPRVYIPVLLFSLPFIFGNGLSFKSVLGRTVLSFMGAGLTPYYFVFLIAQYYILMPIYQKTSPSLKGNIINIFLSLISIGIVTFFNGYMSADLPIFIYAGFFPVFTMFFSLGCYLGCNEYNRIYNLRIIFALLPLALFLAYLEDWYLRTYYTECGLTISTFIFVYLMIWLIMSQKVEDFFNTKVTCVFVKLIAKIGKLSFVIFLLHVYIINSIDYLGLFTNSWFLNIIIVLFVTTILVYIADLMVPKLFKRYLGF